MQKEWMLSALLGMLCVLLAYGYPHFWVSKIFLVIAVVFLVKAIRAIYYALKNRQYEW